MKNYLRLFLALIFCASLATTVQAQPRGRGGMMGGGAPAGPNFYGALTKLFGDNTSFSASMEMQNQPTNGTTMNLPGKIAFDHGNSRFEMDMSKATGSSLPPNAVEMMKSMGMDQMVVIARPDKKTTCMAYPGLKAYAETPMRDSDTNIKLDDFKVETTELGKETVDGHACVKNKVIVTDDKGQKHESTVWNATDLKNFPIKIVTDEAGNLTTMSFKDVKLAKVDAAQFEAPAGFTKYDNVQTMMMQEMMKRRGGG